MRRRFYRSCVVLVFAGLFLGMREMTLADMDVSTGTFSLSEALRIAVRQNPEILAARKRWAVARARLPQTSTPDDPRVELERMYAPRGSNPVVDAEERNVVVRQEFPNPAAFYYRRRSVSNLVAREEAALQAKELEIRSRVKKAYAMLYLSRHAIHIYEENVALMRQFSRVAEAKYAAGKGTQGDALKAQVELSKMLNELVTLEQEREINRAMLNTLLNRPPSAPLGETQDLDPAVLGSNVERLEVLAMQSRPEIRQAAAAVEERGAEVSLGRAGYLPEFMVQYRTRDMKNGPDTHDAMLGFSVPLYFWKQRAVVREAMAAEDAAQAELDAVRNDTLFGVRNWLVKAQTARRLIDLYRTSVLPQSEQALKVAEAAYRADKIGFLDLLDSVRSLLEFRLEHYAHIAQYEQFQADLEQIVGRNWVDPESNESESDATKVE